MTPTAFAPTVELAAKRIERHDGELCCFISTRLDAARAEADDKRAGGGSLAGVPYGLKDEFDTPELPTTTGSWRHRERTTPGFSSAPHEAFDAAGAVLMGKTNLSDMGLAPEASSWVGGETKNPFDRRRTSGGSSGGSAAAVAFGLEGFDWGTDIGGSIRLPAAFCGILGLKLSAERWPLRELFPIIPESMRWLLGQGPLAHTTDQLRAVLDAAAPVIEAPGPPAPFTPERFALYGGLAGQWPTFADDVSAVLRSALELDVAPTDALAPPAQMQEVFGAMWASHFEDLLQCDPTITLREGLGAALSAAVFRGAFGDKRFHPLTAELLLAIAIGRVTIFRDRDRARQRAFAIKRSFEDHWTDGAVVVAPVVVYPPPIIGRTNRNPNLLAYTAPGNLADATGLSIPFGTFDGQLPRAIQLMGPPGSERALLDLADAIIEARDRVPALRQPAISLS